MNTNTCTYCNRTFSYAHGLRRHHLVCKQKELQTLQEQHEKELQTLQEQHEKELQKQREFIQTLQEQHKKEVQALKEQLSELKTQLFEIAKQPKTVTTNNTTTTQTNSRNTAIINQLAPFDLTKDQITQMFYQHFNQDTFRGGPDEIAKLTAQVILTDSESQKPKVICTDISRKNFKYVELGEQQELQVLQVDPGFQRTHDLLKEPLSNANIRVYVDELKCADQYRDQWRKNEDFITDRTGFSDKMLKWM
jgi:chromosome segregation ATPase